jgi:hypothetical protein
MSQDRELQLMEAAMEYLELLEQQPISIASYLATVDPGIRSDLSSLLVEMMDIGEPIGPIVLSQEEQAMVSRATARVHAKTEDQILSRPRLTLTDLRNACKLSLGAVARKLNLPIPVLTRLERGGINTSTLPPRLAERLAIVFEKAIDEVRAAMELTKPLPLPTQLSAQDGTAVQQEEVVDFETAMHQSGANATQIAEWQ